MTRSVAVLGGGLAGLAVAWELAQRGYAVTIFEAKPQVGGRLHMRPSSPHGGPPLLVMGWHRATRALLRRLHRTNQVAWAAPLSLSVQPQRRSARISRPWLPAPFQALLALVSFGGLTWKDRWGMLTWIERTWERDPPLPRDLDARRADAWLAEIGQSASAAAAVWDPLCRFLVGDGLSNVSAALFVSTMAACFLGRRDGYRVGVATGSADAELVAPLQREAEAAGVAIRTAEPVAFLRFDAHRVTGIDLQSGGQQTADWYVSAVPPPALNALLPERAVTRFSYFQQLARLTAVPVITASGRLAQPTARPMVRVLSGSLFDYLVARPDPASTGTLVSLFSVAHPEAMTRPDTALAEEACQVTDALQPTVAASPLDMLAIRKDPAAWLSPRPGSTAWRPLQESPFPNLLLAGDWTDTGLPPSIESAIISAQRCIEAIEKKS